MMHSPTNNLSLSNVILTHALQITFNLQEEFIAGRKSECLPVNFTLLHNSLFYTISLKSKR